MNGFDKLILKYQLYFYSNRLKIRALKALADLATDNLFGEIEKLLAMKNLISDIPLGMHPTWSKSYLTLHHRNLEVLMKNTITTFKIIEGYVVEGMEDNRYLELTGDVSRILVQDWLINDSSQRVTIEDFLEQVEIDLSNIVTLSTELRPDIVPVILPKLAILEEDLIHLNNLYAEIALYRLEAK